MTDGRLTVVSRNTNVNRCDSSAPTRISSAVEVYGSRRQKSFNLQCPPSDTPLLFRAISRSRTDLDGVFGGLNFRGVYRIFLWERANLAPSEIGDLFWSLVLDWVTVVVIEVNH